MTIEDFEILARKRFDHCLNLLTWQKHKEYTRDNDKLYNFKRAGEILRCTPEQALIGMWIKQIVSLIDIVEDIEHKRAWAGDLESFIAILEEKVTDVIAYVPLLEALIKERMGKNE